MLKTVKGLNSLRELHENKGKNGTPMDSQLVKGSFI